jgi:hypothetical protein
VRAGIDDDALGGAGFEDPAGGEGDAFFQAAAAEGTGEGAIGGDEHAGAGLAVGGAFAGDEGGEG